MHVRLAWLVALVLVFSLVTVTSLCHASPPDQTWFAGLYDDVVRAVAGAIAILPTEPPQVRAPISPRQALSAIVGAAPSKRRLTARLDRAPPLA